MVSGDGSTALSSGVSVAVVQLPSLVGGSVVVDGLMQANAITLGDSSDDDNGGASIPKVNNKEIVSSNKRECYHPMLLHRRAISIGPM